MKCASCGKDNVADARYCVNCGAQQSVPTPIAVAAAAAAASGAMSRATAARTQAANAAQVDPGVPRFPDAGAASSTPAAWPDPGRDNAAQGSPAEPGASTPAPVQDALPRLSGLAAALAGGCILVAIIAFVGWKILHDDSTSRAGAAKSDADGSVMSTFPPGDTPQKAAGAPPSGSSTQAAESAPAERDRAATPAAAQSKAGDAMREAAPAAAPAPTVEIRALPARPGHATPPRRAPVEKRTPSAPPPATPAPESPVAPLVAAAPPVAVTVPVPDRWSRMKDDLSRCTREDFISRVICDQRVRWRYCDGYWGKVAQCPSNPTTYDRGQ